MSRSDNPLTEARTPVADPRVDLVADALADWYGRPHPQRDVARGVVAMLDAQDASHREQVRAALEATRNALHDACLKIGSTEGFREAFAQANAALDLLPDESERP